MKKEIIGAVDIGGTKILVGLVDGDGNILSHEIFLTKTGMDGAEQSVSMIITSLKKQCYHLNIDVNQLLGIGIICTGPVNCDLGSVENPYTLGWINFNITKKLNELMGLKTVIENDANGALLGEVMQRHLENQNVLMVTFGTGIGVASYNKGYLHGSHHKYHPEMGHLIVSDDGPNCYCQHIGCFESLCSGHALNRLAKDNGFNNFEELLISWKSGNDALNSVMKLVNKHMSNGIWNLVTLFKPNYLILGGGFMNHHYQYFSQLIQKNFIGLEDFTGEVEILQADEQGLTALLGASQLIKNKIGGIQ